MITIIFVIFLLVGGYACIKDGVDREFTLSIIGGIIMIGYAVYLIYTLFS